MDRSCPVFLRDLWESGNRHYSAFIELHKGSLQRGAVSKAVLTLSLQGQMYDSFHYGMREVRMLQELLLFARPQSALLWEFTDDYSIVKTGSTAGEKKLVPTHRFWFVKQFSDLTPQKADALETVSDNPKVLFTAFAGGEPGQRAYTLHVANLGAERDVTLRGVPAEVQELRTVRTSETEDFLELAPVKAESGVVKFRMPVRCLLTLTNSSAAARGSEGSAAPVRDVR